MSMTVTQALEERLIALETKASFAEDALDQLDLVIQRQQRQIDSLQHQIARLHTPVADSSAAASRNPRDELPPHY